MSFSVRLRPCLNKPSARNCKVCCKTIRKQRNDQDEDMNSGWHDALLLPRRVLIGIVQAYRLLLSPWLGGACRFEPTCSVYAITALERRGAVVGSYLTFYRLARCQPWCDGGHDPVPTSSHHRSLFTRLINPLNKQNSTAETKSS